MLALAKALYALKGFGETVITPDILEVTFFKHIAQHLVICDRQLNLKNFIPHNVSLCLHITICKSLHKPVTNGKTIKFENRFLLLVPLDTSGTPINK
jgi:hypothetical protein